MKNHICIALLLVLSCAYADTLCNQSVQPLTYSLTQEDGPIPEKDKVLAPQQCTRIAQKSEISLLTLGSQTSAPSLRLSNQADCKITYHDDQLITYSGACLPPKQAS